MENDKSRIARLEELAAYHHGQLAKLAEIRRELTELIAAQGRRTTRTDELPTDYDGLRAMLAEIRRELTELSAKQEGRTE